MNHVIFLPYPDDPEDGIIYDVRTKEISEIMALLDRLICWRSRKLQKEEPQEKMKQPESKNIFCRVWVFLRNLFEYSSCSESLSDTFAPPSHTILFVRSEQLLLIKEKLSEMPELTVIAKDMPGDFRGVFGEMKQQETTSESKG